eukprot:1091300-Prymnesium_polylepis.1
MALFDNVVGAPSSRAHSPHLAGVRCRAPTSHSTQNHQRRRATHSADLPRLRKLAALAAARLPSRPQRRARSPRRRRRGRATGRASAPLHVSRWNMSFCGGEVPVLFSALASCRTRVRAPLMRFEPTPTAVVRVAAARLEVAARERGVVVVVKVEELGLVVGGALLLG